MLVAFTQIPGIHEGQAAPCDLYLKELRRQLPDYANLGIANSKGFVLCDGSDAIQSVYVGDRSYLRDAVATGRFVAGGYIMGRLSGKPSVAFATSISAIHLPAGAGTAFVVAVSMDRGQIVGPSQCRLLLELAALSLVTLFGGWVA